MPTRVQSLFCSTRLNHIACHLLLAGLSVLPFNIACAQNAAKNTATTVPGDRRRWSFRVAALPSTTEAPVDVPVRVTLPPDWRPQLPVNSRLEFAMHSGNTTVPAQVMVEGNTRVLWWVVPASLSRANSSWDMTIYAAPIAKPVQSTLGASLVNAPQAGFSFRDEPGQGLDVLLDGRAVARYMYARDLSTPERDNATFKTYWHFYDAQGKSFITKGPGGLFPHHRGLFLGWNKLSDLTPSAATATATLPASTPAPPMWDLWHMTKKAAQVHQKFLVQEAGPVLARTTALIHWNDGEGKPLLSEERTVTFFRTGTDLLLDWQSKLSPERDIIRLDGDPEHSGLQFRPSDDVGKNLKPGEVAAKDAKRTSVTYLFPRDGVDAHKELDMPWAAMQFELYGQPYSVQHLNAPDNPKSTLYSAYRDYGRFGAFAKGVVTRDKPLLVRYGIAITNGALPSRAVLAARYDAFVQMPQVEIVR